MYKEFNQHKKSDTVKWIIAFTLIIMLMAGVVASLYLSLNSYQPAVPKNTESTNTESSKEDEIAKDSSGVVLTMGQVKLMSVSMLAASEEQYVSQTVTATITPATVVDKYVTWSLAWASNAPLKGSDISEYIQITDDSQGNLTATINCYKSFKGSKAILTCTTRQGGKTGTVEIVYEGVPSSMVINAPSGVTQYNLGTDSVDLLYAGNTYSLNLTMDNIFHDVGSNFNDFDVTVIGIGTVQYADYVINPRGKGFNIDYSNIPTMSLDSMKDKCVSAKVENGVLKIEAKDSYFNYYESFTVNETYGGSYGTYSNHYYASVKDSDGNNPYFLVTIKHKTLGFSAQYKFFIGEEVNSVTTNKTTLTF